MSMIKIVEKVGEETVSTRYINDAQIASITIEEDWPDTAVVVMSNGDAYRVPTEAVSCIISDKEADAK